MMKALVTHLILRPCEAVCPKEISLDFIARMNREYGRALIKKGEV